MFAEIHKEIRQERERELPWSRRNLMELEFPWPHKL